MTIDYDRMTEFVVPLSQSLYRLFPMVALGDIQQEMYEWFPKNPTKARDYLGHEDPRQGNALLSRSLLNKGRAMCLKEKAVREGYEYRDLVFYSEGQIADLLPSVYDAAARAFAPKAEAGETRSRQDPAHGGNYMATLADIADAIRKLDAPTRVLLQMRYLDDLPQTEIARQLDLTEPQVSERLSRAPARLLAILGGEKPAHEPDERTIGRRRAISNSQAQAITGESYEG